MINTPQTASMIYCHVESDTKSFNYNMFAWLLKSTKKFVEMIEENFCKIDWEKRRFNNDY